MLKKIVLSLGSLMLAVGLLGFFVPNFLYLVQFDLIQSFIYSLAGGIGISLAISNQTDLVRRRYFDFLAILSLSLLIIGLSFPNWGDLIHLEVPEHFFHAVLGLAACLASDYFRKKT